MASVKTTIEGIEKNFDEIFSEFINSNFKLRQEAIQAGAEVLMREAEISAPKDTTEFASKFAVKKYKDHRYVGNTKVVKGKNSDTIPLINILEYDEKTAFFRKTYDACENEIFQAIKNKLNGG